MLELVRPLLMRRFSARPLPNGAFAVHHVIRYGVAECEVMYTILPGTSERARDELTKAIARAHVARLKCEKRQAAAAEAAAARRFYARIVPKIRALRERGLSLEGVAAALNDAGEVTRTGLRWSGSLVNGALKAAAEQAPHGHPEAPQGPSALGE